MRKFLVLLAGLALSMTATAQQNDREGMWEFGVLFQNTGSDKLNGADASEIDIDSSLGYGITLGYNFTNRLSLSGDLIWNQPDYEYTAIPDDGVGNPVEIKHELSLLSIYFKGTFNFMEGPFTPFVEAGFGWVDIDSNVADQPPITGCWWDPWWGYICDTFYSTYSKTQETYGAAAGFRLDLDNGMSLKGSYGIQEVATSKSTDDASFDAIRLDLIWRF